MLDHRVEKLVYVFQVDIEMCTCSMLPIEFEMVMCQLQHRNLPKGPSNVLSGLTTMQVQQSQTFFAFADLTKPKTPATIGIMIILIMIII